MPKIHALQQHKVIRILEDNGFKKTRSGKHITFKRKNKKGEVLTTWVPHHKEVSALVINYIIKQTKKPREEFE